MQSSSKFKQKMDSKESRNKDEKRYVPDLPPELTVEILTRVPVKALMRFRCVCKSWLFIISDPKFVKKHLNLSIIDEKYSHHRAIVTVLEPYIRFRFCSLNSIYNESCHDELKLDFSLKDPERRTDRVVGSYNGLLCIVKSKIDSEVVLWNPSTRQIGIVPNSLSEPFRYRVLYGFGYDESVDDYKVVSIYQYSNGLLKPPSKIYVKVFTLRTNSWRKIGGFQYNSYPYRSETSIFVRRSLHWLLNDDSVIVALDLATETFSELPLPDISFECHPSLGILGGHLCISCGYPAEILADVWAMKEYGVRESWTRLFTIPYPVGTSYYDYMLSPKLLCFAKNGELLLHHDSQLLVYNPKDNTFRSTHGFLTSITMDIYVESLVSPNAHDPVGGNTNS